MEKELEIHEQKFLVEHYFNGEYDLSDLTDKFTEGYCNGENVFSLTKHIDGETTGLLVEENLLDKDNYYEFLKKEDIELPEGEFDIDIMIIEISCPVAKKEEFYKRLSSKLFSLASEIMDNASGDDDFFDYCPNTVETIGKILTKMGFEKLSEKLDNMLEENGHFE